MTTDCPHEDDLYPLAHGDETDEAIRAHVAGCLNCQRRVSALREEVSTLRTVLSAATIDPAGEHRERPAFIGKYFIAGQIGEDENFAEFRAAHALLHQQVRLTLAKRMEIENESERKAFANSIRPLLAFSHPHAARALDLGFHGSRPFVVEEDVPGVALDQYVGDAQLDWRARTTLVSQIAEALVAARQAGLTDFSTRNMRAIVDEEGEACLAGMAAAWLTTAHDDTARDDTARNTAANDVTFIATLWRDALLGDAGTRDLPPGELYAQLRLAGVPHRAASLCAECARGECAFNANEIAARLQALSQPRGSWWIAAAVGLAGLVAAVLWLVWR